MLTAPTKHDIAPAVLKDWLTPKPVDGNASTVEALMLHRMPELFGQLQRQIERALPLELLDRHGFGSAALMKNAQFLAHMTGLEHPLAEAREHTERKAGNAKKIDFAGVYVFLTAGSQPVPFYVGITRSVLGRVRNGHIRGRTHHQATLLFQLVRSLNELKAKRRKDVILNSELAGEALNWLKGQKVAILPLACPVERYAIELYASVKLQTGRWNTFETH